LRDFYIMTPFKVTSVKTDKSLLGIGVQYEAQYATIHNKFQTDLIQKKLVYNKFYCVNISISLYRIFNTSLYRTK